MKALFIGNLQLEGCSGGQRLWALRQCGVEVAVIDKCNYLPRFPRISTRIAKVIQEPRLSGRWKKLESDFIEQLEQQRPDLVWMEWPKEFRSTVILKAQQIVPHARFVSMQDDNPWGDRQSDRWMWRDYFRIAKQFDTHLVKRTSDVVNLKKIGAKRCIHWEHGVFTPLFHPHNFAQGKEYDVSFVGTCMDKRSSLIRHLLESGVDIHIFGTHWDKRSDLPKLFPENFHPAVRGEAYADVIRRSFVCLGLISHSNHDEWTMRSYEVPGCGSMLLAERSPTHQRMFEEGLEADFFSSVEECGSKLQILAKQKDFAVKVGKNAHSKFHTMGWTLDARMKDLLSNLV